MGSGRKLGEDSSSKNDWRAPLPGDDTYYWFGEALSQGHQAGTSEPIASRSISDRCQIPDELFRIAAAAVFHLEFLLLKNKILGIRQEPSCRSGTVDVAFKAVLWRVFRKSLHETVALIRAL